MTRALSFIATVATMLALVAPASAAGSAPAVATTAASNVSGTSATLNGTVNPEGEALTTCQFTYSADPTFLLDPGKTVPCASLPTGTGASPVSATATGLTPSTTYYYELTAANASGSTTSTGGLPPTIPQSFTTTSSSAPPAPTATTSSASTVTGDGATLNGTVNPEGQAVQSCVFQYGTTSSYGQSAACSPTPSGAGDQTVSATLSGLASQTTYHFQVVITTAGGTGSGGDQSFTTLTVGTASTGPADAVTATSATFHGTVDPEGQNVQSCDFYYGTGSRYQASVPCSPASLSSSGAQDVSAQVTGLARGTAYHYVVLLTTDNGRALGNVVDFTTLVPPTAHTGAASLITRHSVTLHATVNGEGSSSTGCEFQYASEPLGSGITTGSVVGCSSRPAGTGSDAVSASLARLRAGTTYYYRILFATRAGYVIGQSRSFKTVNPPRLKPPGVRIIWNRVSHRGRSAEFSFDATGTAPTAGYECSLVAVRGGRAGRVHWSDCASPIIYRGLARGTTYEFAVRAGNAYGFGAVARKRVTI